MIDLIHTYKIYVMIPFHNQRVAGDKAFYYYTRKQHRYVLLRADVQAGKTGTYQYLIRKMLERGIIDRAYIICGSHELELINQCRDDILEWHPERKNGEVKVLFRQHFEEKMNTHRALIVVDETHLVCDKDQTLSTFLQRHNLTMMGTTPEMIQNETYILSVDATPFAELSAIEYESSYPKAVVTLENAAGYFGPMDYFRQGLIRETYSFADQRFNDLVEQLHQKYILVRITGKNRQDYQHLISAARRTGCDIVRFTSKEEKGNQQFVISQEDADKFHRVYPHSRPVLCLESAPLRTTIVIVDGRLRCGKRLVKTHIGAVWETSKGANTDIIIQGLLGRMCGYDVPAVKPLIFLPPKCITTSENKIIEPCDLERAFIPDTIPRYASHIIPSRVQKKAENEYRVQLFPCVPIQFQLSAEDTRLLDGLSYREIRALCMRTFSVDMINETFKPEQREEIIEKLHECIAGRISVHIRRFQNNSHSHYFKSMLEAVATNTTINEHIDDYPFLTFCVTYPGYHNEHAVPGQVFAVIYTESIGLYKKINLESRIPKQDGKTHFTLEIPLEMRSNPAGTIVSFTPAITNNPAEFKKQFDELIKMSKTTHLHFSREIVSLNDGPICFQPRTYGMRMQHFNSIIAYLERKHSVQIIYERPRLANIGHNDSLYYIVTRISW